MYITILVSAFIFSKCAQQMAPTGGERDLYPPILDTNKVSPAVPENFSTNFNSSEIALSFDEYFLLDNPEKNIIITPIPTEKPEYRVKGKKLVINLGENLMENTTYTINFGNAIKDITEGNVTKNFNYVFSTGSYIDSLFYVGKVYDAYSKRGLPDVTVMLYEENNDSVPFTERPLYFVKTSTSGGFNIRYLKAGKYKAIALLDQNNDYQYNPKNESIAFLEEQIIIPKAELDSSENRLLLFKEDVKRQFVADKKYSFQGKVNLNMNRVSDDLEVKGIGELYLNPDWISYSENRDSIEFWIDSVESDKKTISIIVEDKTNAFSDTVKIVTKKPKLAKRKPLVFSNNVQKGLELGENLGLTFSKPLSSVDTSKIEITSLDKPVPLKLIKHIGKDVVLSANWKEGAKYSATIFPNAFIDLFGETTDTLKLSFRYKETKDYGKLLLNMELEEGDYILQLISSGQVVSELFFEGGSYKTDYNQLPPGKYQLKLIYDKNSNKKWDTGDYLKHIQPERVEYYDSEVSIRQGWDIDVTWKIK